MNICFVTRAMPAHGRGGMEDHTLSLAKGVVSAGHAVTVITTGHPEKEYEVDDGVSIYYLKGTRPRAYSREWSLLGKEKILELHKKLKFDILHSQSAGACSFLLDNFHTKARLPTVISLHGTPWDEIVSRFNIIRFRLFKKTVKNCLALFYWIAQYLFVYLRCVPKADAVIATSNEQEKIIKKIFFLEPGKVRKVYNGMDLRLFSPGLNTDALRSKLGIKPESKILLCVARFVQDKGIEIIIKAMPHILKQDKKITLLLVGGGALKDEYLKLSGKLKIYKYIKFTGYVEYRELPEYFSLCDVFINPTIRKNGYDLTMLQAMACQKVVIATDIGSNPTLIEDEEDGILTPTGDEKALAEKILNLLRDKNRAEEIGKNAIDKVNKYFTTGKMVTETIRVYKSLLSPTNKASAPNLMSGEVRIASHE